MRVTGPKPLDSENAETTYASLFFHLQKMIVADMKLASSDNRHDRAVIGAVVAIRVLLEAFTARASLSCHNEDFREWKQAYLEWFDANCTRIFRQKNKREEMRRLADAEFDRIIELSNGVYRFSERIKRARDKSVVLPYYGEDGRLEKIPPLA